MRAINESTNTPEAPGEFPVAIRVWGEHALFAISHFRADPVSYPYPPPSACAGLMRAIYWKPEGHWEIDTITLLRKPRMVSDNVKGIGQSGPTLQSLMVLRDLNFIIEARWVKNPLRPSYPIQKCEGEIYERLGRGEAYRSPCLGRFEYPASYELLPKRRFGSWGSEGIRQTEALGTMLYDLIPIDKHDDHYRPVYFRTALRDGQITVPMHLHDKWRPQRQAATHAAHPDKGPSAEVDAALYLGSL